jgi:predicted dehydrogenase
VSTTAARRKIGVGVIGFGWLGQAHTRSLLRIPTLFEERAFDTTLVACSDALPAGIDQAVDSFGFRRASADWRVVIEDPDVEVVYIAAPNMVHVQLVEAVAQAGKDVFCEKPVGGTPEQVARAARAAREAGVISGVGYNYRWAPLVRYARELIAGGELGEITNYRGRFFSMYGADPLGVNSWRFQLEQAGYGVTSDSMSHAVDRRRPLRSPRRVRPRPRERDRVRGPGDDRGLRVLRGGGRGGALVTATSAVGLAAGRSLREGRPVRVEEVSRG